MADLSFVGLLKLDPTFQVFLSYATSENFVGHPVYSLASRAYLRPKVAEALVGVQNKLRPQGLRLKIWDAYRPFSVQERLWSAYPHAGFVAEPVRESGKLIRGSDHNRGAAVDVTLVDVIGTELEMPTPFDEFSERAHRTYMGATKKALGNRKILEDIMHQHNFQGLASEWWHFRWKESEEFPLADVSFEELLAALT